MPDRIPHAPGKSTPSFVEGILATFGQNSYGEPMVRLIWSERPQSFLAGEIVPTYEYLQPPRWVLETWLPPETYAGPREAWGTMQQALMGDYPSQGTYFIIDPQLPVDWTPSEVHVQAMARYLMKTRELDDITRRNAKIDALEKSKREGIMQQAQQIDELFDSASLGKIQQAATGPKNTFRTPEDWERDRDRAIANSRAAGLPRIGGKIYQPED